MTTPIAQGPVDVPVGRCRSYRPGAICADGFIQKPICAGSAGCLCCWHISDNATPNCQREDVPAHWLRDDGSPLFYVAPN